MCILWIEWTSENQFLFGPYQGQCDSHKLNLKALLRLAAKQVGCFHGHNGAKKTLHAFTKIPTLDTARTFAQLVRTMRQIYTGYEYWWILKIEPVVFASTVMTWIGLGSAKGNKASMGTTQGEMVVPKFFPRNGPKGTYSQAWMSRAEIDEAWA